MKNDSFQQARMLSRRVVVLAVCIVLVACSNIRTVGKQGRGNTFVTTSETYAKLLRWGYYDEAVNYLRAQDGSTVEGDLAGVSRYRISAYKNLSQLLADNGREGRVTAMIEYYEIDSGVLHTLRDEQFWWFDDELKRWFLASPLPAFGAAVGN